MKASMANLQNFFLLGLCLLAIPTTAQKGDFSVNYRGQAQRDLPCAQVKVKDTYVRNDPSSNCFGFPTVQFDEVPVVGGKPNGMTIDWSLMVDELSMKDYDRLHIHLPGFGGALNTFGIMGASIDGDTPVDGIKYTPDLESQQVNGDSAALADRRADFGALLGIYGISCGTEAELYMDRAKVDSLYTAEWDPTRETLKLVIKGQRQGGTAGRLGSTGTQFTTVTTVQGASIPPSVGNTEGATAAGATNSISTKGFHLQTFEYVQNDNPTALQADGVTAQTAPATAASLFRQNTGWTFAPGNRMCGIYIDATKLWIGQKGDKKNGLGPLPPVGGIGKNWYKTAYIRKFDASRCSGGKAIGGISTRPGMSGESCSFVNTKNPTDLDFFWQVPFDGDSERVVGYRFSTLAAITPPTATVAPTFTVAKAEGSTNGIGKDNCIIVTLVSSVTMMSGSSRTQITIGGLKTADSSSTDTLPLYSDKGCTSAFSNLAGSNGAAMRAFDKVPGSGTATPVSYAYRPIGLMSGTNKWDAADWHTRAMRGTTTALTETAVSGTNRNTKAATPIGISKLSSTAGTLPANNGLAKFDKATGEVSFSISPGYFLQAGEVLVFSFKLKNPATETPAAALTAAVTTGTYCKTTNLFCYTGLDDENLVINPVPITGPRLLEAKLPYFRTAIIHQSSTDPESLTTLFVTLRTNVDLKKNTDTSDAKLTISNLCGFQTGINLLMYQNQKAGGQPYDGSYPMEAVRNTMEMPGLPAASADTIIGSTGEWTSETQTLTIPLGRSGLVAGTKYAFAFQLQTGVAENAACTPRISSGGGSDQFLVQDMTASNVGKVDPPMFTTVKIGQTTTRPDVTNYLCVTLKHNYKFYSDSVVNQNSGQTGNYIESKITISGLLGSQAVSTDANSKGYHLTYCPTDTSDFDAEKPQFESSVFQPDDNNLVPKSFATHRTTDCFPPASSTSAQACIPGNPYMSNEVIDTTKSGRSWFKGQNQDRDTFLWDQASGTATLTVDNDITKDRITNPQTGSDGGIPKNAEIVFAIPLQNPKTGQGCQTVTFQSSGNIVQTKTFTVTQTGRAIQDGEEDGDACPLKVYEPRFVVKTIRQSNPVTDEANIITVSLRSNVDLVSFPSGKASEVTISGLTGTTTTLTDLDIEPVSWKYSPRFQNNQGKWDSVTGTLRLKLASQSTPSAPCLPPTVWAQGPVKVDGATAVTQVPFTSGARDGADVKTAITSGVTTTTATKEPGTTTCIKAGYLYVFQFRVQNPKTAQPPPPISVEGVAAKVDQDNLLIARSNMNAPVFTESAAAMNIGGNIMTTYDIGQLIPSPDATNLICVTLKTSKALDTEGSGRVSSITIQGLTGFATSERDVQLYRDDGFTKILPAPTGTTQSVRDSEYNVGDVFASQNRAATSGSANTEGITGAGFARYMGGEVGDLILYIQGDKDDATKRNRMIANYNHKFCFQLKNPPTGQPCLDPITLRVDDRGTVYNVAMDRDLSTSLEDYGAGSACPRFVAEPQFIVREWRQSSYVPGADTLVHLTLSSNYELTQGEKFTISGLNGYTQSCANPPCDVSFTVTRTQTTYKGGKLSINAPRHVISTGAGDEAATSTQRKAFAHSIQSYDLSARTGDGALTSTFGSKADWGVVGDTTDSVSTMIFTVANQGVVAPSNIAPAENAFFEKTDATIYELVFTLTNKNVLGAEQKVAINIDQFQSFPVSTGTKAASNTMVNSVGDGGMTVTYTATQAIYGGESLVLTLPKFHRDTNGPIFGVTSAPNDAFETYASRKDWKAYKTAEDKARVMFTNGWHANGITAKSGDSGVTGEAWNVPNNNHKQTDDASLNHDTGVFVLDSKDPGVGMNKNYWYANTDDYVYQGRITPVAQQPAGTITSTTMSNPTADYFLDNGEELKPIAGASTQTFATTEFETVVLDTTNTDKRNNQPAPAPATANVKTPYTSVDNFVGTPPFLSIPSQYQPSRRDNYYKGMLLKCWIGTNMMTGTATLANLKANPEVYTYATVQYSTDRGTGAGQTATGTAEYLPPPYRFVKQGHVATGTSPDTTANANAISKAGISRTLEVRTIQASFRQIDYIPRKGGGCTWAGAAAKTAPINAEGCQDEVPGYPAMVRLTSPFSRALDPDTLCYITRKADVGVYTGMRAMIGNSEYILKQGAANIYTVAHVDEDMVNGDDYPVDRKVPRSYSTEDDGAAPVSAEISTRGIRAQANTRGFFKDDAGLSGQPYLIYSQLELVAAKGSKVSVGEQITITIPTAAMIHPPMVDGSIEKGLSQPISPQNDGGVLKDYIMVSHVLLVPVSPACSIVSVYGVMSGCHGEMDSINTFAGASMGGTYDLMLSQTWPFAHSQDSENDITGLGMQLFGGQSTVIKTKADMFSQNLPLSPLNGGANPVAFTSPLVAPTAGTETTQQRFQKSLSATTPGRIDAATDAAFTIKKELEEVALTSGKSRTATTNHPRLSNSPLTLTDGACGSFVKDTLGAATSAYAVCLGLGISPATNHETTQTTNANDTPYLGAAGVVVRGVKDITGEVGGQITPSVPAKHAATKTSWGNGAYVPEYGSKAFATPDQFFENPADNVGLGAFIIVGVYTDGASDKFVGNDRRPSLQSVNDNVVVQRWLGVSRTTLSLEAVPAGLIGGSRTNPNRPAGGYPAPAGNVPRWQARVLGGYTAGRWSYKFDGLVNVRSDMTHSHFPIGSATTADIIGAPPANAGTTDYSSATPSGIPKYPAAAPFAVTAVPSLVNDNPNGYTALSGMPIVTSTPSTAQTNYYGTSTLPYPQVIHTAQHTASSTARVNRLSRGHTTHGSLATVHSPPHTFVATSINANEPFSRDVMIEQGMDVYIISSLFDTLIQRPEPLRFDNGKNVHGRTDAGTGPGNIGFAGANANSYPHTAAGILPANLNAAQKEGTMEYVQTAPPSKATGAQNSPQPIAAANNYGYDADERLFGVLGPFQRQAVIRDVKDTSKMTIHQYASSYAGVQLMTATAGDNTFPKQNQKFHLAPVTGSSITNGVPVHTYAEHGKIITFCNPLQGVKNNAPGAELAALISEDLTTAIPAAGQAIAANYATLGLTSPIAKATVGMKASAQSLVTMPRRHQICRKLLAGHPLVDKASRDADTNTVKRQLYAEPIQWNQVLNQEPSPNMRAMVTFIPPTMVKFGMQGVPDAPCEGAGGTIPSNCQGQYKVKVPGSTASSTVKTSGLAAYRVVQVSPVGFTIPAALQNNLTQGVSTVDIGKNAYDSSAIMSEILDLRWSWQSGVTPAEYTLHDPSIPWNAAQVASVNPARRSIFKYLKARILGDGRLECQEGEVRVMRIGNNIKDACKCDNMCGQTQATCGSGKNVACPGGNSTAENSCHVAAIGMSKDVCKPKGNNNRTGKIVGGVLGGFFGLLLLGLLAFLCCRPKPKPLPPAPMPAPQPGNYEGRPIPPESKPLAPVYLPQPYPALPEQYAPAPMPGAGFPGVYQPTGQPTLYSSYQGVAPPGQYPAPYGVTQY